MYKKMRTRPHLTQQDIGARDVREWGGVKIGQGAHGTGINLQRQDRLVRPTHQADHIHALKVEMRGQVFAHWSSNLHSSRPTRQQSSFHFFRSQHARLGNITIATLASCTPLQVQHPQ